MSRLDVAMFNAILRESAEEMPTDPVSDPIADSNVLPVPSGRSSFGAGAQLKNAVSSFKSLWLCMLIHHYAGKSVLWFIFIFAARESSITCNEMFCLDQLISHKN